MASWAASVMTGVKDLELQSKRTLSIRLLTIFIAHNTYPHTLPHSLLHGQHGTFKNSLDSRVGVSYLELSILCLSVVSFCPGFVL